MKTSYKFKNGMFKISAKVAGERLTHLYEQNNNALTPKIVIEDAKDKKSVLHPAIYHCNEKQAAEKYWLIRASQLLRNLTITVEKPESNGEIKKIDVRVFHNIQDNNDPYKTGNSRYIMINDALEDKDASDYIIQQALTDMIAFRDKYQTLDELKPYSHLINEIIDKLKTNE